MFGDGREQLTYLDQSWDLKLNNKFSWKNLTYWKECEKLRFHFLPSYRNTCVMIQTIWWSRKLSVIVLIKLPKLKQSFDYWNHVIVITAAIRPFLQCFTSAKWGFCTESQCHRFQWCPNGCILLWRNWLWSQWNQKCRWKCFFGTVCKLC